jgi:hypothetical protein
MTKANHPWLRSARPVAWVGAVLFFLIAEGSVIASEWYRHLYRTGSFHFWFVPIMCIMPLALGYNVDSTVRRDSAIRGYAESGTETSSRLGMLVLTAYVAIATAAVNYF